MPNTCEKQLNYFLFHQSICLTFAMCGKKYECIHNAPARGNKYDGTSIPPLFQLRSDIQVSRVRNLLCDANNLEKKKNFQTIQHLVTQIKIRK